MKTDDEVWYDLTEYDMTDNLRFALLRVLKKIPEEVYDYVIENVYFTEGFSRMIPLNELKKIRKKQIVIIEPKDLKDEFTIAHEIAHAFLKHKLFTTTKNIEMEMEADKLAEEWGFKKRARGN
jgi:Zn-dependent peptidase ImmA (M78 family)